MERRSWLALPGTTVGVRRCGFREFPQRLEAVRLCMYLVVYTIENILLSYPQKPFLPIDVEILAAPLLSLMIGIRPQIFPSRFLGPPRFALLDSILLFYMRHSFVHL